MVYRSFFLTMFLIIKDIIMQCLYHGLEYYKIMLHALFCVRSTIISHRRIYFQHLTDVYEVSNNIKFNLAHFKYARSCMSTKAAKMFMHSMIFSHITYCLTTWSQASNTSLKPILSLYKQTLKVLDKKTIHHTHHCDIKKKNTTY